MCNLGGSLLSVCYVRGAVESLRLQVVSQWLLESKTAQIKIQQSKSRVYRVDRDYAPSTIIDTQTVLTCGATLSC